MYTRSIPFQKRSNTGEPSGMSNSRVPELLSTVSPPFLPSTTLPSANAYAPYISASGSL